MNKIVEMQPIRWEWILKKLEIGTNLPKDAWQVSGTEGKYFWISIPQAKSIATKLQYVSKQVNWGILNDY